LESPSEVEGRQLVAKDNKREIVVLFLKIVAFLFLKFVSRRQQGKLCDCSCHTKKILAKLALRIEKFLPH
jgi:hypothetical protein